jgi:hypothetical protein
LNISWGCLVSFKEFVDQDARASALGDINIFKEGVFVSGRVYGKIIVFKGEFIDIIGVIKCFREEEDGEVVFDEELVEASCVLSK